MYHGELTLCVLLSIVVNRVHGIGNYVILAPNYIQERQPYHLSVSTFNSDVPSKLQISVQGFSEADETLKIENQLQLAANVTQLVKLNTAYLDPGAYTLRVSGADLDREFPLSFLDETYVVLIQTDKPLYRPGNTVKFRILVLNQTTKPLTNLKSTRVTISDPDENVIKVWSFAKIRNGAFYSQLDIANEPNHGNWTITANVRGKDHTRAFLVDDYKLPKHEIKISTPKVATPNDEDLIVDIDASYTFGRPMKGDLTVTAYGHTNMSKTLKINGRARVRFNIGKLFDSHDIVKDTLIPVEVSLLERYTKRTFNTLGSVQMHMRPVLIELDKSSEYFIPGYPYNCWFRLSDRLREKLNIDLDSVSFSIVYIGPNQFLRTVEENLTPDNDGVIPLILEIPKQATEATIDVQYDSYSERFLLSGYPTVSPVLFKAFVLTRKVSLNQPISIQVHSSIPLDFITYQVVSKRTIVDVKRVEVNNGNTTIFHINTTIDMIPKVKIFVFSVHNNTILSDSVIVEVLGLPNMVNLTLSEQQVAPGQRVKLTVQSTAHSIIGLSAVDQGLLQLSEGNPINQQRIWDALEGSQVDLEEPNNNIIVISNMKQHFELGLRFGQYNADEEDDYIPPRRQFSDSWLWYDMNEVGSDGKLDIWDDAPSEITSWKISGFSLSPDYGLGILDQPLSLKVFKPFFIMLNFPNSIKKSETAVIEVTVFNYLDEMLYVGVSLKNTRQEYIFIHNQGRQDAHYQAKNVVLTPNSATTTKFYIKPKKLGNIVIKVIAESSEASDSVERLLRITPESLEYSKTDPRYIQLDNSSQTFRNMRLEIPRHIDAGSEKIRFSVQGNLLGNKVGDLPDQIRLPFGSGEQNILKMIPNLVVLNYIENTGTYGGAIKNKALQFLETGYQNQLKYKLDDGSFSMFGKDDGIGSIGLTALVAITLQQASQYITVDEKIIEKAYDWLQLHQKINGSWVELNTVYQYGLYTLHNDETTLTAFTQIAFLEDKNIALKYNTVVEKATSYLSSKYYDLSSSYSLAMTAYAMQLANHDLRESALERLLEHSKKDHDRLLRWWDSGSTSTETTGYALLTYIEMNNYIDAKPIVNWLVSKQHYGVYYENTLSIYVAFKALAKYALKVSTSRNDYDVTVTFEKNKNATIHIDPQSSLVVQEITLPPSVRVIDVTLNGTGTGTFKLEYRYFSNILKLKPRFDVKVETLTIPADNYLPLTVCAKFLPREKYEETALVLMEITFPSGYIALDDSIEELEASEMIKKVSTKYGETSLQLYFDSLPLHYECLNVTGFRQSDVLQQIPGTVRVYDFYDNSRVAISYFDGKQLQICDICENDCPPECSD
ncbi:thioester-containing protein 1 allele R1-like [Toxorhynchites rutilus septentrionalis]|uniref:thioester-containing protein 1 allele R1-like n=1 Tax=Toxorhynchites rutilus septentrionalis TaxID=329112 RepID=UPI0024796EA7|nr:thioester-containing protein 1 allele R1-like [Toxorhynchites rutilus septentrionalis]